MCCFFRISTRLNGNYHERAIVTNLRTLGIVLIAWLALHGVAASQKWQRLKHEPTFAANTALLLTDGTVMVQDSGPGNGGGTNHWWRLTPDSKGSYVNGTWTKLASMSSSYGPLYHAAAVLPDGRALSEGGEYNFGNQVETNQGAIYDPLKNKWTSVNPPNGWSNVGDAPSVILPNGTLMLANPFGTNTVLFNAKTLKWTPTGAGKLDIFAEEGLTLLPDGTVLVVDTENGTHAEKFLTSTAKWVSAGSTIVVLPSNGGLGIVPELGPAVLRPDGTVFAAGATSHTSVYHLPAKPTHPGKWVPGPDFPNGLTMFDGPAALLPNGNVLCMTSPSAFSNGTVFFEWDGNKLIQVPDIPGASGIPSFVGDMLVLPTGQILLTTQGAASPQVMVYTAKGSANPACAPTITSVPTTITRGSSYVVKGTQFNGLSQGAAYGDDTQAATNYPLVRITNHATKHVFYSRTHNHSTMAVATGSKPVSTHFDVPDNMETGVSSLVVVANGLASKAVVVTVQ
jgi:hypothetical protein